MEGHENGIGRTDHFTNIFRIIKQLNQALAVHWVEVQALLSKL